MQLPVQVAQVPMQLTPPVIEERVVHYNPVSLFSNCLIRILKDSALLPQCVKKTQQDLMLTLLPLMRAEAKRIVAKRKQPSGSKRLPRVSEGEIEKFLFQYLHELIKATDMPLERACLLHILEPKLDRSDTAQRLLEAVSEGKHLNQEELTILAQTFDPAAILEYSFADIHIMDLSTDKKPQLLNRSHKNMCNACCQIPNLELVPVLQ